MRFPVTPRTPASLTTAVLTTAALCAGVLVGCTASHPAAAGASGTPGLGGTDRVVYRSVDTSGPTPNITTVVQEVMAPYRARSLTYQGDGTTTSLGGTAWTDGGIYTIKADGSVALTAAVIPEEAGPDSRLGVSLPVAVAQHLVTAAGGDQVLGHRCELWESKEPLDTGEINPPTAADHATSCVDAQGRILRDSWYLNGALVRTRTAIEVSSAPALDDFRIFGGQTPAPALAGIAEEEVKALTGPTDHDFGVRVAAAPAGFSFDGAVALRDSIAGGTAPVPVRVGQVSAYRSGTQLIVIKRVVNLVGTVLLPRRGATVSLGVWGQGKLEPRFSGLVVSFVTKAGVLVEVTGSLSAQDLLAWVRTLRAVPAQI